MVKIKICGIGNLQDAIEISNLEPDYIGVISERKSPRYVSPKVIKLMKEIGVKSKIVIVMQNERLNLMYEVAHQSEADILQIHRIIERPEEINKLSKQYSIKVIIALLYPPELNYFKYIEQIDEDIVEGYLIDSSSKGEQVPISFVKALSSLKKVGIAGGLDSKVVGNLLKEVRPYFVDASSKLEIYPGKKDLNKVKEFIEEVRRYDS
jgi:phosphoribosylanthranilate isomerase